VTPKLKELWWRMKYKKFQIRRRLYWRSIGQKPREKCEHGKGFNRYCKICAIEYRKWGAEEAKKYDAGFAYALVRACPILPIRETLASLIESWWYAKFRIHHALWHRYGWPPPRNLAGRELICVARRELKRRSKFDLKDK
jgi:hypothetical protein